MQAQEGDVELLVAAPGDLVQIEMQSFTTRVGAVTNVEHNNFPPTATITSCLEGTSIAPFSTSVYCTRRFSWVAAPEIRNYDLVFVSRDNIGYASVITQYEISIHLRPEITSIDPTQSGTPGGDLLTVFGSNFDGPLEPDAITIGGVICSNPVLNAPGELQCEIPEGQGFDLPVVVTVNNLPSQSTILFSYLPSVIDSIFPTGGGGTAGGYEITLTGTNFGVSGQVVTIGGIEQNVISCTHFECIVEVVGSEGGANQPVIITVGGQSSPAVGAPTYSFAAPTLISHDSVAAPTWGGTSVTVNGENFGIPNAPVVVTIGEFVCPTMAHNQVEIWCVLPPNDAGGVHELELTVNSQPSSNTLSFQYDEQAEL